MPIKALLILALTSLSMANLCHAEDTLTGTWRLTTQTVAKVTVGKYVLGTSRKQAGTEFLTFNADHSVTGSEWLLSGHLAGVEQANYDGATGNFFPTSAADLPPITPWTQKKATYQVGYDINRLRFSRFYTKPGASDLSQQYLMGALVNRNAIGAVGEDPDPATGNTPDPIPRPYIYRYTHTGRLSKDQASISGKISVIAIDLDSPPNDQQLIYITTTYTGSRFGVTSACCGTDGAANEAVSQAFLDSIDAVPGIQTTASGLRYLVLQEGTGTPPKTTDWALMGYRGFFPSGATFDAGLLTISKAGSGLVDGLNEGLLLMKRNAKYRFFLPSGLAYGDAGKGNIGPKAALVFDIELFNP